MHCHKHKITRKESHGVTFQAFLDRYPAVRISTRKTH